MKAARTSEELDLLFGALADSTRRAIIEQLAVGEATVSELAAPFAVSMPAISRHLKVLERASVITRSRQGRWRSATLSPVALAGAATWLETQERLWTSRLDRLDDHLARSTPREPMASRRPGARTDTKRGRP